MPKNTPPGISKRVQASVPSVGDLLKAMGKVSARLLCSRIKEALSESVRHEIGFSQANLGSMTMRQFGNLWRAHIGPRYYAKSVLSIERQVEVFNILGKPLQVYRQRKSAALERRKEEWESKNHDDLEKSLGKAAWDSENAADTPKGKRLQFGFRNGGCSYWQKDKDGVGCYNCGYFRSGVPLAILEKFSQEQLNELLQKQLQGVLKKHKGYAEAAYDAIDIVSDGSFLNEGEVSKGLQDVLFQKINGLPGINRVLVESLPEYVTAKRVEEILGILSNKQNLEIAIGLESADEFVAAFCINKSFFASPPQDTKNVFYESCLKLVDVLQRYHERCSLQVYLLLKPALLTEAEAITDTLNSILWLQKIAYETRKKNGKGLKITAKIEPVVVCRGSLLEVLHNTTVTPAGRVLVSPEDGEPDGYLPPLYEPPSYWSLLEVLAEAIANNAMSMVRVGAREDMDEMLALPGVYENGMRLSGIDPILYNAAQDFNCYKQYGDEGTERLLVSIRDAMRDSSFEMWRLTVQRPKPRLTSLFDSFAMRVDKAIDSGKYQQELEEGQQLRQILETLSQAPKMLDMVGRIAVKSFEGAADICKSQKLELEEMVLKVLQDMGLEIFKKDVKIEQLQYIFHPSHLRFELNFYNDIKLSGRGKTAIRAGKDLWVTIIPPKEEAKMKEAKMKEAKMKEAKMKEAKMSKNKEIERKWIIDNIPEGLVLPQPSTIIQGYLGISKQEEVRIRQKSKKSADSGQDTNKYFLTVKSTGDRSRNEYEVSIDEKIFEKLLEATRGRVLNKDRYDLPYFSIPNGKVYKKEYRIELDIYKDKLHGLCTAEVEFKSEEKAKEFKAPNWFGREVTFDRRFKNQSLAIEGLTAIILPADTRYTHSVICFDDLPKDLKAVLDKALKTAELAPGFKLHQLDPKFRFVGCITRETAKMIWGCAALITEPFAGDPSQLVLLALASQTQRAVAEIIPPAGDKSSSDYQQVADSLVTQLKDRMGMPRQLAAFSGQSISDMIRNQAFVDNELLNSIEKTARIVHVLTTTWEFDLGELKKAVFTNLKNGKKYRYYLPYLTDSGSDFLELRRNLPQFKELYKDFRDQIEIFTLPPGYLPHYHEIVLYVRDDDPNFFGFTYLERQADRIDWELIELPKIHLPKTLQWLGDSCNLTRIW